MARKPGVSRSSGNRRGARARVGGNPRRGASRDVSGASPGSRARRVSAVRDPPNAAPSRDDHAARVHASPHPPDLDLRAHRRDKQLRKRRRARASTGFSLVDISDRFAAFVLDEDADVLTLPPYSKHQVVQIASLAAIYGLDARLRRGIGRAKDDVDEDEREDDDERGDAVVVRKNTRRDAPIPSLPEGPRELALARLLASETKHGKPRGHARDAVVSAKASRTAAGAREIGLRTPVPEANKGAAMLRAMGWRGGGLGAAGNEGTLVPLRPKMPKRGVGLGANRQRGPPRAGVNPSSVFVSAGAQRPGADGDGDGDARAARSGGDGTGGRGQGGGRGGRILRRSRVRTSSSRQPPKAAAGRSTTSVECLESPSV